MNEGVAAISGVPGHVLEFQTLVEIHPQESFAVALGLAHSGGDVAKGVGKGLVDVNVRKLRANDEPRSVKKINSYQ
jgi:hypothetical protein